VKNPFIIAGGRFKEFYYWDSYWIIRGLIVSEMYQTTRGILENFLSVIDRFGHLPNGGRIYYLARSQPPLLPGMIKAYVDATHDFNFAISSIELLEREFEYFMGKMVTVKGHRLARYIDSSSGPRPESYREDMENASKFATEAEKQDFYAECKAGGESGMDFSSRW
jgi:alpha,alpha-trehalase